MYFPIHVITQLFLSIALILISCGGGDHALASGGHFLHGVASGDPLSDRVILWTRVSHVVEPIRQIRWEIATDADFTQVVRTGIATARANRDYTVKVDVGNLQPGQDYFYRFIIDNVFSPSGRTRTLPIGKLDELRLAIVSCANYPAGYFYAYRVLAEKDVDVILHLGDYIYENGPGGYAAERAKQLGRTLIPDHELISLEDYRQRHALYKTDPDLQLLHARFPFIASWDDHESANNSWMGGAQNHQAQEGDWGTRRDAALRAYYEWLPVREPTTEPIYRNYRSFQFGDLASLFVLETRFTGRDKPLEYTKDLPLKELTFAISDLDPPVPITDPNDLQQLSFQRLERLPVPFDMRQRPPQPILDYNQIIALDPKNPPEGYRFLPDLERFQWEILGDPRRQMLGMAQEAWLKQGLEDSKTQDIPWQILGNQILLANVIAPNLAAVLSESEKAALPQRIQPLLELTRWSIPYNLDAWDGYPAARQRLYKLLAEFTNNAVVVTGDTHNAWAIDLKSADGEFQYGVEIATPSITSPGIRKYLNLSGERLAQLFREANPQIRFLDLQHRGYTILTLSPDTLIADYYFLDTVSELVFQERLVQSVMLSPRSEPGTHPLQVKSNHD